MRKDEAAKTTDRWKHPEATVVPSQTILELRNQREKVDAAKAARGGRQISCTRDSRQRAPKRVNPPAPSTPDIIPGTPVIDPSPVIDEAEALLEEMEALEVGGDGIGQSSGVVAAGTIRLRGGCSLRWS